MVDSCRLTDCGLAAAATPAGARRWSGRQKGSPAKQRNSSLLVSARQVQALVRRPLRARPGLLVASEIPPAAQIQVVAGISFLEEIAIQKGHHADMKTFDATLIRGGQPFLNA